MACCARAVCCALCGAVGARDVSECDWRRAEGSAASRRVGAFVVLRARVWRAGGAQCAACEAWRAMCCVRSVLRMVRCGRRASQKRARGGGGLKDRSAAARRGVRGLACVCALSGRRAMCCVRGVARNVLRASVLRMVRCGRRASRKRVRGGGGLKGRAASRRAGALWCACVWVDRMALRVPRARRVAVQSVASGRRTMCGRVRCAPCGAVGARAGSEYEAAAG